MPQPAHVFVSDRSSLETYARSHGMSKVETCGRCYEFGLCSAFGVGFVYHEIDLITEYLTRACHVAADSMMTWSFETNDWSNIVRVAPVEKVTPICVCENIMIAGCTCGAIELEREKP